MERLISIVVGFVLREVYAWLPRLSEAVVTWAASRLRSEDQERYLEEWTAHLQAFPNTLARLFQAFGCALAALRLNAAVVETQRSEIETLFQRVSAEHRRNEIQLHTLGRTMAKQREPRLLEAALERTIATYGSVEAANAQDIQLRAAIERAVISLGEFRVNLIKAVRTLWLLTDQRVELARARLERERSLVTSLAAEYGKTFGLPISSARRAAAIRKILTSLNTMLEETYDEEDAALAEKHAHLLAVVQDVAQQHNERARVAGEAGPPA